jgi:cyclic-di-AMP phosphodiesterase PgpH
MNAEKIHALIGIFFLLLIAQISLPPHNTPLESEKPKLGEISERTIIAPITFDIPKPAAELEKEREQAKLRVDAIFNYDEDKSQAMINELDTLLERIKQYSHLQVQLAVMSKPELIEQAANLFQLLSNRISPSSINQLAQSAQARDSLRSIFADMIDRGITDVLVTDTKQQAQLYKATYNLENPQVLLYKRPQISLIRNNSRQKIETNDLMPKEQSVEFYFNKVQLHFSHSQALQSAFYEVLYGFSRPNIFYLPKQTEAEKNTAAEQVNPSKGKVIKGMEILRRGNIITPEALKQLEAMNDAMAIEQDTNNRLYPRLGLRFSIVLLIVFFASFFFFYHKRVMHRSRNREVWALVSIIALQLFLFRISWDVANIIKDSALPFFSDHFNPRWLAPFLFAPILSTLLLGLSYGLGVSVFCCTYLGMLFGFDLLTAVSTFAISSTTIFFLREIRYRSQFILAGGVAVFTFLIVFSVENLLRNTLEQTAYLQNVYIASAMILVSTAITILFLAQLFERIFKLTTHMTLIELADFNNKILRHFSTTAPSSFHHSIMVGNLAEKAAEKIGADTLLTRVMALYHDIGKSVTPQNFTENQTSGNPHDEMDPWESVEQIRAHVLEGIRLAKEYRIPPMVTAAIPEHHGDNIIRFFYHKALNEPKYAGKVDVNDFKYNGPRPQSRETAILMLADSIEAAARSLKDPAPEELLKLVQQIVYTRLFEDQLQESGLTLADLRNIEYGFLQALEGMFHTRITYPDGIFANLPSDKKVYKY